MATVIGSVLGAGKRTGGVASRALGSVTKSVSSAGQSFVSFTTDGDRRVIGTPQATVGGLLVFFAIAFITLAFALSDTIISRKNRLWLHAGGHFLLLIGGALVIRSFSNANKADNSVSKSTVLLIISIGTCFGFKAFLDKQSKVSEDELNTIFAPSVASFLFVVFLFYFVDGRK
jgi:hypothetical protein